MNPLFIHVPKSAGSSVKNVWPYCVKPSSLNPDYLGKLKQAMDREGLTHHAAHGRWRDIKKEFQENCFAVVRNPWSRTVSRYTFLEKINSENGKPTPSFNSWMETRFQYENKPYWWHRTTMNWFNQFEHVSDERGLIRCQVFKLEEPKMLEEFLGVKLPKKNASNPGRDYRTYYDTESARIIEDWYRKDIEEFDYKF